MPSLLRTGKRFLFGFPVPRISVPGRTVRGIYPGPRRVPRAAAWWCAAAGNGGGGNCSRPRGQCLAYPGAELRLVAAVGYHQVMAPLDQRFPADKIQVS